MFQIPVAATRRNGFTLLELMLVLAILAILGSIASPFLANVFERQKLTGAVETIRLQWEEARLKAMRTGQAQVFSCQVGAGQYAVKPLVLQSDAVDAGTGATLAVNGGLIETENMGQGNFAVAADLSEDFDKELENKITFLSCMVASDMRAYTTAQASQSSGIGSVNTQNVGQSVIFYPDGSTSTAEVQLQNERGDVKAVQIRGLTGSSRVVEVISAAATDQKDS